MKKLLEGVFLFAALHAASSKFEWEGHLWAGVTINLSSSFPVSDSKGVPFSFSAVWRKLGSQLKVNLLKPLAES